MSADQFTPHRNDNNETQEKGSLGATYARKPRNIYKDALFFSGLVTDKRFKLTVRYIDWVDLAAGPAETFSGAFVEPGVIPPPDKSRVLMVKAAKGRYAERKPWVNFMILYPSGYLHNSGLECDASYMGWELDVRDRVLALLKRTRQNTRAADSPTPAGEIPTEPELEKDNTPAVDIKAGEDLRVVCSKRLEYLLRGLPGRSPQSVIEFALHRVSLEDFIDSNGV